MPQISRVGDIVGTAGQILRGSVTAFADGRPIGLHPSPVTPHPAAPVPAPPSIPLSKKKKKPKSPGSIHPPTSTMTGSTTVFVDGQPVLLVGSQTLCGHSVMTGSTTVFVGK